ncbi:oocyte zinc finger protein XlCOF6-like [Amphibalanus amphitrite]|uniref:oocyte zinc finger protein XlCOF6-like n=1 Tax=Amphibalanus amphitrite TaxID=1232801 RepID=UPI001C9248F4|nr:oocyte zinc finger protein XlCOF6-like [Amphibalanus amphitrite]XP_043195877.1 oocyte zinc finger protein XlCOF6-like [Amphibalanus amphitrite]XP_043195878.1 oocyte zinc finger protein XlCOF6-like [Amphibalanus amphitrite]XP_043195880.1 oocyte zinc finger protein XlCOF6-like [Amphibalanus amphitrite]
MASLQSVTPHDPSEVLTASERVSEVVSMSEQGSACEVCAAEVAEASAGDEAACRAAATLLGADSAPLWLCRACAELLRAIDGHRRELETAQRLFWRRHRQGAQKRQSVGLDMELTSHKVNGANAALSDDELDSKNDKCAVSPPHGEKEENTTEEISETVPASDDEATGSTTADDPSIRRSGSSGKQCTTCGKEFRTWRALDGHVNSHTGARPYACSHCDRRFSSRPALRQHQGIHFNKWACELCGKVYSTEPALSTHRSYVHFPERLKTITCPVCGKEFLGQKRYNKHSLTHSAGAGRFTCPEEGCDSSFKTRNALNVHIYKHQGKRFACDQCPAMFSSKASMQQHMVRHGAVEARFPCPHCPRRFIYNSILRCHLASAHSAERDCVCEVCGATFTCNSALNAHKLSHQEERPHVCTTCGAAFKRKQILERHVRFVHNREVAARCEHCDKGFPTQHKLKVHMRSHTGERPFSCPLCEKRFSQRSHVRSHMQLHVELRPTDGSEAVVPAVPLSAPCPVAPPALEAGPAAPPALEVLEVAALLPVTPVELVSPASPTTGQLLTPPSTQQ